MSERIIEQYVWECPDCATVQVETVLEESGPFYSCTCEHCGHAFDRDRVTVTASKRPA